MSCQYCVNDEIRLRDGRPPLDIDAIEKEGLAFDGGSIAAAAAVWRIRQRLAQSGYTWSDLVRGRIPVYPTSLTEWWWIVAKAYPRRDELDTWKRGFIDTLYCRGPGGSYSPKQNRVLLEIRRQLRLYN